MPIEISPLVLAKAAELGDAGREWLDTIDDVVASLADEWELEVGDSFDGGSAAAVLDCRDADGRPVVLKVAIPEGLDGGTFATDLHALRVGDPRVWVPLLRVDEDRRALLLGRLGRPMAELGWPVERQIDALADTMKLGWHPLDASDAGPLKTGAQQAADLIDFIDDTFSSLDAPCDRSTVDLAKEYARRRRDAFDPATAVLVHGDAHPGNVLECEDSPTGFRMVDPEAMLSEPAHDLAIPLRDWTAELRRSGDAPALGRRWCEQFAHRAGIDPQPIWEWASTERLSTGLYLMSLGAVEHGRAFLDVADQWAAADNA